MSFSEKREAVLYERFPYPCITVTPDGIITDCNRLFRNSCQSSNVAIEGTNITVYLRPGDQGLFLKFLGSVEPTGSVVQQNIFEWMVPGSGEHKKMSVRATAIENNGILLAMEDVTRLLDYEEERKMARRQLYRSAHLASIGTLASGLAHEINNPLTALLGFSSALLKRINENEDIDRNELGSYLKVIYDETIRCRDIVDHLHRFARESGEVNISRVSLTEIAANAQMLVKVRAIRSELAIVNELGMNSWVRADANRLEQVFVNLLANCIDFCGRGATVTISETGGKKALQHTVVTVRDNGPGMTPEVLARAFDPFFTTKEVGKGMGMGLAICHKIMEELNGRIDCISEPGKGCIVRLEIPAGEA
jgi:two-component system, NtrC family, sensor kinase